MIQTWNQKVTYFWQIFCFYQSSNKQANKSSIWNSFHIDFLADVSRLSASELHLQPRLNAVICDYFLIQVEVMEPLDSDFFSTV